jgi:ribonuclease Z
MKHLSPVALFTAALLAGSAAQADTPADTEALAKDASLVVTLLGTGSTTLDPARFGYSTLVQANGLNLVFDAGRGNTIRLAQLGIPLGKVTATFITHYRSDHINGLADLWGTGFLPTAQNRRVTPFELYGPPGLDNIVEGMEMMYTADLRIRREENGVKADAEHIAAHTFHHAGVVYEHKGVKVTAFEVNRGEYVKPSYGYKVQYNGHTVALSGDTRFDPRVSENAKGADVVVHEVGGVSTHHLDEDWAKSSLAHHTSPEQAGEVFAKAQPRLAVFSHISRPGPQDDTNDDHALVARAQKAWPEGHILLGQDLTRIYVGKEVKVVEWAGN